MPRFLLLLCAYLLVWVPVNFAALAAQSLSSLSTRGGAAVVELIAHGLVAILCAVAAWMLRSRNPAGRQLALGALPLNAAAAIQALYASALPRDVSPGLELPLAVFSAAVAVGWMAYLIRSRAVSNWLGED